MKDHVILKTGVMMLAILPFFSQLQVYKLNINPELQEKLKKKVAATLSHISDFLTLNCELYFKILRNNAIIVI